jgi:hypothetical protein
MAQQQGKPDRLGCLAYVLVALVLLIACWGLIGGLIYELWQYVQHQLLPYLTPGNGRNRP